MTANFDMVIAHPAVANLGLDALEQARIGSFTVDLCHWLAGAPVHSLGLLARVTLMIVQGELHTVQARCTQEGEEALIVEAAVAITSELWPRLRRADETLQPEEGTNSTAGPVLGLLRECCGLDLPELLYLTQALEAELNAEGTHIERTAAALMDGIAQNVLARCGPAAEARQSDRMPSRDQSRQREEGG
jgi:hypothetical protein